MNSAIGNTARIVCLQIFKVACPVAVYENRLTKLPRRNFALNILNVLRGLLVKVNVYMAPIIYIRYTKYTRRPRAWWPTADTNNTGCLAKLQSPLPKR